MKNIVILGAGFAGVTAASNLLKNLPEDHKLILINKQPTFTFKPLLQEVATGAFSTDIVCEDFVTFLKNKNFEFVQGTASKIDLTKQLVTVGKQTINYAYLLIAIGAQTNFFNTPGAEKHAFKLDTIQDAFKIKKTLLSSNNSVKIAVIGGGPTGIELSTEISGLMKQLNKNFSITILDRSKVLLPRVKEKFRDIVKKFFDNNSIILSLDSGVTKISKGFVLTTNGKTPADLVIWTAGVKPAAIQVSPKIDLPKGYFPVDSYLRLNNYKNVFAVGDCAFIKNPDGNPVPLLAQSAVVEGKFVAKNILAAINKNPLSKFSFSNKGFILPLGKGYAAAEIKSRVFSGFFVWWLNRTTYLLHMFSLSHKLHVVTHWTIQLFHKRNTKK